MIDSRMRAVAGVGGLLLAVLLPTAPAQSVAATNRVVLGVLLPPEEPAAAAIRQSILLAVEAANRQPGQYCEPVIRGRVGQWGADAVEAGRMVLDDGARLLIAPPDGSATHLVLQVAGRTATPVLTLCADSSVTGAGVPWMVRLVPRTQDEAACIFETARTFKKTPRRWAALVPAGRAGREAAADLRQAAEAVHGQIEVSLIATNEGHVADSEIRRLLAPRPDGILVWVEPRLAGELVQRLGVAGYSGVLTGPARLNCPEFFEAAGSAAENFLVPGIRLDRETQARVADFDKSYQSKTGRPSGWTAAMAYDAGLLGCSLLRRPAEEPLERAFPLAFTLPGLSGTLTFDANGNRIVKLRPLRARHGRFVPEPF